jgi:ADP-ribose pyrophosphatase YjhB (NUDIX family)
MDEIRTCFLCQKVLKEDPAFCESCGNFVCTACLAEFSHSEYDSAYPVGICEGCHQLEKEKSKTVLCPKCGTTIREYRSPLPTVDILIQCRTQDNEEELVLILRKKEPKMWALPGGFCEYGESLEEGAVREAKEETGLDVELIEQFYTYSDPRRDPRHHSITTVFLARSMGEPTAGDDAGAARLFKESNLPDTLAFDHGRILDDYLIYRKTGVRPRPAIQGLERGDD